MWRTRLCSAQQRALLRNYHSIPSPTRGSSASEVVPAGDFYSQTQYAGGDRAQNLSRRETNGVDLEGGYGGRSRKTTMDMLGLTFGKHAKRGITSWFVIAGVLHFALDGIFVIFGNSENMTSEWMAPWRVYAQEDERYSRRSSLINAVQVLGAFVHGPLCFVAGWGIHRQRNWYPIVAILVSFCELYNRVILISTFDSLSTKLDNPSPQFLFAFVTWNLLWIVIPAGALGRCFHEFVRLSRKDSITCNKTYCCMCCSATLLFGEDTLGERPDANGREA